jgi:hypothetical protein
LILFDLEHRNSWLIGALRAHFARQSAAPQKEDGRRTQHDGAAADNL